MFVNVAVSVHLKIDFMEEMMELGVVLYGKPIVEGVVEGEAFVSKKRINLLHDIDMKTGRITREDHDDFGKSIAGKILVFPSGVGSVGLSSVLYTLVKNGVGPKAIVNQELETTIVFGALIANVPMVAELDRNPVEVIRTGDRLRVDGGKGIIQVL
ncbi:MAG: aconitase X swivel domain-containing protein [Candidatus Ranarchaeia archaeon]